MRLRTDGKITTITLKDWDTERRKHPIEYETTVADFDTTANMLSLFIGEPERTEKMREIYRLGHAEIVIDKYEDLPHYMEIEAPTEEEVQDTYARLGKPGRLFGNFQTGELYRHYGIIRRRKVYRRQYSIVLPKEGSARLKLKR